jgi:hypothetical protein
MTPDWIETGAGDGRQIDLTGMRLSPQSLEARLLDGITTITPLPRYLTFRSWIVLRYWQCRQPDRWQDFIEFAARQESALSLGLAALGYEGANVVGIDPARTAVRENGAGLPIRRHTVQTATSIYTSSSDSLGLTGYRLDAQAFGSPTEVPALSRSGNELAQIAEQKLGRTAYGKKLLRDPNLVSASRKDLTEFANAFLPERPEQAERKIIVDAMFARRVAQPELFSRRGTYGLLLEAWQTQPGVDAGGFFALVADGETGLRPRFHRVADDWCIYALQDMLAVAYEAAVRCVVDILEDHSGLSRSSDPDVVLVEACAQVVPLGVV